MHDFQNPSKYSGRLYVHPETRIDASALESTEFRIVCTPVSNRPNLFFLIFSRFCWVRAPYQQVLRTRFVICVMMTLLGQGITHGRSGLRHGKPWKAPCEASWASFLWLVGRLGWLLQEPGWNRGNTSLLQSNSTVLHTAAKTRQKSKIETRPKIASLRAYLSFNVDTSRCSTCRYSCTTFFAGTSTTTSMAVFNLDN